MWNPFRDENHSLFPFFRCFFVSFFFVCLLTQPKRNLCTFGTMVILIYVTSNSSFEHSTFLAHMNGVLGQKPLFLSRNNNKKLCAKDKNHVRSGGNKKCLEIIFFFFLILVYKMEPHYLLHAWNVFIWHEKHMHNIRVDHRLWQTIWIEMRRLYFFFFMCSILNMCYCFRFKYLIQFWLDCQFWFEFENQMQAIDSIGTVRLLITFR